MSMSMHTTQEWHSHANFNMSQARSASHKAGLLCSDSRSAHEAAVSENIVSYDRLTDAIDEKVKATYKLVERLQHRAESAEVTIRHMNASYDSVDQAIASKEGPMQLCNGRMEQRERRPLREQVRDHVEVALEGEKATLVDAQKKLNRAAKKTRERVIDLENSLAAVRMDIEQKLQALGVDENCLSRTLRSMEAVVQRTPPREGSNSGRLSNSMRTARTQVHMRESSKNETDRQQEAEKLNRVVAQKEEAARRLAQENQALVVLCQGATDDAAVRTQSALKDRVDENQRMRKALDAELRDISLAIDGTKRTMAETAHQIGSLGEPAKHTSVCASWRTQRAPHEHIVDPVSTRVQEHRQVVMQARQDLVEQSMSEKSSLRDLKDRRERLKEDLRDKTAALNIDADCLRRSSGPARRGNFSSTGSRPSSSMPHRGHHGDLATTMRPASGLPRAGGGDRLPRSPVSERSSVSGLVARRPPSADGSFGARALTAR